MFEPKMAVCIAVIAKENYPLFLKTLPSENELKSYYTVHTSLDGLLYPTEDYKVYGYVTNTKIKFIIVVNSYNITLRDNDIRSMFRKLHNAYVDMVCNPFYTPGEKIISKSFHKIVSGMMVHE
ncbi:Trafficking protein particle complex subunit 2-like protein [Lamellibrachia satsuma]|nr:Trafficking protein particle complex subunit 2-like protein [Lamellibrachia satsuma]